MSLKRISRIIERLIGEGKQRFAIYPFGEQGMRVKWLLEECYGISPMYLVDNGITHSQKIITTDKLKEIPEDDFFVLLASDNPNIYAQIRTNLANVVPFERIIDLFSPSSFYDDRYYDPLCYKNKRISTMEKCAREIYKNSVSGAIAECGVYRGGFAAYIRGCIPDRKFYLFDTFEGFDERDIDDREDSFSKEFRKNECFRETEVEIVMKSIPFNQNVEVRKGWFPDTVAGLEKERFAFVSLDTDLYKPILAGLDFFWPRMNPGGYIMVDDLSMRELGGARQAILDFCRREHVGYVSAEGDKNAAAVLAKPL